MFFLLIFKTIDSLLYCSHSSSVWFITTEQTWSEYNSSEYCYTKADPGFAKEIEILISSEIYAGYFSAADMSTVTQMSVLVFEHIPHSLELINFTNFLSETQHSDLVALGLHNSLTHLLLRFKALHGWGCTVLSESWMSMYQSQVTKCWFHKGHVLMSSFSEVIGWWDDNGGAHSSRATLQNPMVTSGLHQSILWILPLRADKCSLVWWIWIRPVFCIHGSLRLSS